MTSSAVMKNQRVASGVAPCLPTCRHSPVSGCMAGVRTKPFCAVAAFAHAENFIAFSTVCSVSQPKCRQISHFWGRGEQIANYFFVAFDINKKAAIKARSSIRQTVPPHRTPWGLDGVWFKFLTGCSLSGHIRIIAWRGIQLGRTMQRSNIHIVAVISRLRLSERVHQCCHANGRSR